MKRFFLYLIIALINFPTMIQAQWMQTNGPFGGTVHCIAANTNGDIFAGSENGLFRSTDGGVNWTKLENFLNDGYVETLAINNNGNIFAGVAGASNSGVFISNDNGNNWNQIEQLGENQVNTIIISKSGEIFVANGAIFESTDNGNNWSSISDSITSGQVTAFAINNNGDLYAEVDNYVYGSGSLYRSTNSGKSWTVVLGVRAGQIVTNSSGYVFVSSSDNYGAGGVYRSTDNGNNWTHVYSGNPIATLIINSKGDVFAGSYGYGIFRSTNNGTAWMQTGLTNGEIISLAIDNSGNIFAGANNIGAFKSTDNGSNWSKMGIRNSNIYSLIVNKSGDIFAGTLGDGAYRSTDNGDDWIQINNGGLTNKDINSFAINNNGDIFAVTGYNNYNGGIFRSTDNGNNWTQVYSTNDAYYVITCLAINNNGYIFGGINGHSGVYRSTDNGNNWTQIYNGGIGYVNALAINNNGYIFASSSNGFFRSTDNGNNWTKINNSTFNSLAVDNNGEIFAGSGGVFRSTDNGENWFQIGLINTDVNSIVIYTNGTIFAGTSNGGVYYSTNNGDSWAQINEGLTNFSIHSLAINNISENIFIGTVGSGVWRRPLSGLVTLDEIYPTINLSTASINSGESIAITGSNFTQNNLASLTISGPDTSFTLSVPTDNNGNISTSISIPKDALQGTYSIIAVDTSSGKSTTTKYFYVTQNQAASKMTWILQPTDTVLTGNEFQVQWKDLMTKGSNYQIIGATRQYSYNIDISSDGGTTWSNLKTIQGGGIVYSWTNIDATINIPNSGNYKIRIVDNNVPSRILVSNEFYAAQPTAANIKTGLAWDYSYSSPSNSPPIGVAADGVSRIYLTISSDKSISQISVSLSNDEGSSDPKILGKVMNATVTEQFSDEANNASQISTTISLPNHNNDYWIWYVAPDDFVGNNIADNAAASRTVWAKFQISFTDGTSGYQKIPIKIVRPPLFLVSGIGGKSTTWDNLKSLINYNNSRFPIIWSTSIPNNKGFDWGGKSVYTDIAKVIRSMHELNFACNQVICIGHSTGGNYLRDFSDQSFYLAQRNYNKGYINKAILLDTPNQGTPIADLLINKIIEYINNNFLVHVSFNTFYGQTQLLSNPFVSSLINIDYNSLLGNVEPTDLVKDSRTIPNGGNKLEQTSFPVHLIASDFFAGAQNLPAVPPEVWNIISNSEDYLGFVDKISDVLVFLYPPAGLAAKGITDVAQRGLTILDYSLQIYSGISFILDSDWIVSVESQIDGLNRDASNVTIINGLMHYGQWDLSVTSNYQTLSLINDLIDVNKDNDEFKVIPSNYTLLKPQYILNTSNKSNILLGIKENNINISSLNDTTDTYVDSTLNVNFNLQDTVGLEYVKVFFQNKSYLSYAQTFNHEFSIPVNGTYINEQPLQILAVYFRNDSTIWSYSNDTINVMPSSPLQRFFIEPKVIEIFAGQNYSPDYKAVYKTFLSKISSNNSDLKFTVANPNIVSINQGTNFIQGTSKGETSVIISYNGMADTLYVVVDDSVVTGIKETKDIKIMPKNFNLSQNYPNPFNPTTIINYSIPKTSLVTIKVYDILGREVKTLINEEKPSGNYSVQFSAGKLASGIYFYRMRAGSFIETKKLVFMK